MGALLARLSDLYFSYFGGRRVAVGAPRPALKFIYPGATTPDDPPSIVCNLVDGLESFKVAIDAAPGVAASDFRLVMLFDN